MSAATDHPLSQHPRSKILVIDDSASVCFAIERMLGERGLDVSSQRTGAAALEALREAPPDLVLLDLVLPDVEGFEVCALMRQERQLARVPVVVISGIVDEEIRAKALRMGAVGVLKKPFATQDLVDLVERVLSSSKELDLPAPSAEFDILRSTAPAPDTEIADRLEAELERFAVVDSLRFALMVHANGELRGYGANKPKLDSTLELTALLSRATHMSARLGNGDLAAMTIEAADGLVVIKPRDDGWLWAIGVAEQTALGKVRFLLR